MPRYSAYPQYPETSVTPFNPEQVSLIKLAESIIIGARSKDTALRDTCREFIGYEVPREKPLPEGYHLCTECLEPKHHTQFYKDTRKRNGLYSCCKQCHNQMTIEQRKKRMLTARLNSLCKTA